MSLRTIQRIESGVTIPKGHTLTVLSQLMGVEPSAIGNRADKISERQMDQLKLMNISALSFIVIPFGNLIFPFILWRKYREDSIINLTGRYIMNFQIIWTLLLSLLLSISPFIQNFFQLPFSLILSVLLISYCLNIGVVFWFARLISKGDLEHLKVTYQLL